MSDEQNNPNIFLWVLRGLTSAFLLGYLVNIYLAMYVGEFYPSGNLVEDLLGVVFLIIFGLAYYLMWIRKEILTGIVFILWYAGLWPAEILVGGETFKDSPIPGILVLILGILFLVYRFGTKKNHDSD